MTFFTQLPPAERATLDTYLVPMTFPEGAQLIREGDRGDGCHLIERGTVRLEVDIGELETDGVLGYLDAGSVVGELSLLDDAPRSAAVWAHTPVETRFLSEAAFWRLQAEHPRLAIQIVTLLARELAHKMRTMNDRLASHVSAETVLPSVDAMVGAAQQAQAAFETWSEERVDALLVAISQAVMAHAKELAQAAVEETGLGNAADKEAKIQIGAVDVLRSIQGRPGAGALGFDPEQKILRIAAPVGVVFGLVPLTNPVSTFVFKALICLKARNAVILSCHRSALGVGTRIGSIIQHTLETHGAPVDLVQWVRERSSRRKTASFMAHPGVGLILATGGPGMVQAAYSSGTPAIGVGAGNAPVYLAADADLERAAQLIVRSKSFDNGVICGSENNLVVHASVEARFRAALEAAGAIVLTPEERRAFQQVVFADDRFQPRAVGQAASRLLAHTGIDREPYAKLVVLPADRADLTTALAREKPAPVLSLFTAADDEEALAMCLHILRGHGSGHTAVIHTADEALAHRFGLQMPVSRVLVNQLATLGCVGFGNALNPTFTLGCGTWGGGSTTDNVTVDHLCNVKRLVFPTDSAA